MRMREIMIIISLKKNNKKNKKTVDFIINI